MAIQEEGWQLANTYSREKCGMGMDRGCISVMFEKSGGMFESRFLSEIEKLSTSIAYCF